MAFLFGRNRQKTPPELVRALKETIGRMDQPLEKRRASEEVSRLLSQLKLILQGNTEAEPSPEQVHQLCDEVLYRDILPLLANNMYRLDFEAKKDVTALFNALIRYRPQQTNVQNPGFPAVDYLSQAIPGERRNPKSVKRRPDTLITMVRGYEHKEIANNCGTMLRESFKHESLAAVVLEDECFWNFFDYVQGGSFDIASDAFSTFRELLTRNKVLVSKFLSDNYMKFFEKYNTLLASSNYVTKRQSIKLLGEILLDRANYSTMLQYVDSPENLKLTMNLLRDKSKNIQYEAFHVFKVFVANPKKSKPVEDILIKNREKLLVFLPKFHEDRKDDEQFVDEKSFLMKQIKDMGRNSQQHHQQYIHSEAVSA